jgi:hypothetical protein
VSVISFEAAGAAWLLDPAATEFSSPVNRAPRERSVGTRRIFRDDPSVRFVAFAVLIAGGLTAEADSSQDQIARLIAAARAQIGVTRYYDSSYTGIRFQADD